MAPSQLTRLKASIHDRRSGRAQASNVVRFDDRKQEKLKKLYKSTNNAGEERRWRSLLPELQKRHRVGGIVDRRIGEDDPTLAPEDRAIQRFSRVSQLRQRNSQFNLEDESDNEEPLTHLGQSLLNTRSSRLGVGSNDDDDLEASDPKDEASDVSGRPRKKRRLSDEIERLQGIVSNTIPDRKKTRKEIMGEVMAKSKLAKYERQKVKDDDDDVREELDKEVGSILAALRKGLPVSNVPASAAKSQVSSIHPDRMPFINGGAGNAVDTTYDQRVREIAMDKRAQPTERTKTEEEKARVEAARLKELEEKRLQRMTGENVESVGRDIDGDQEEYPDEVDEAAEFGLSTQMPNLDFEDEDNFVIDDDLVASASDLDLSLDDEELSDKSNNQDDVNDEEFLEGLALPVDDKNDTQQLAFTYPCPQDHAELLSVMKDIAIVEIPTVVQRIRALHHPQLKSENKVKLSNFSVALVDHLYYIASSHPPLAVIESLIRHIHSLSRSYADAIARAFRSKLQNMHESSNLGAGDLIILTAIGSIYPTSDHFHQVVTPAITIMAHWLGIKSPRSLSKSRIGAYLVALCIRYQALSKRYIPEALRFTLAALKPESAREVHESHISNLSSLMELWAEKSAFIEIFAPDALAVLEQHKATRTIRKLRILLDQARLRRRPLELHHHRPIAIRMSIPKFEENFDPNKHYDPDRERADASRLRKEYKREHKGALRELKKDASFIAREQLRMKKEKDRAYEVKQRRLIAEIQGEEGRERNAYDRERQARKRKR